MKEYLDEYLTLKRRVKLLGAAGHTAHAVSESKKLSSLHARIAEMIGGSSETTSLIIKRYEDLRDRVVDAWALTAGEWQRGYVAFRLHRNVHVQFFEYHKSRDTQRAEYVEMPINETDFMGNISTYAEVEMVRAEKGQLYGYLGCYTAYIAKNSGYEKYCVAVAVPYSFKKAHANLADADLVCAYEQYNLDFYRKVERRELCHN